NVLFSLTYATLHTVSERLSSVAYATINCRHGNCRQPRQCIASSRAMWLGLLWRRLPDADHSRRGSLNVLLHGGIRGWKVLSQLPREASFLNDNPNWCSLSHDNWSICLGGNVFRADNQRKAPNQEKVFRFTIVVLTCIWSVSVRLKECRRRLVSPEHSISFGCGEKVPRFRASSD
ncbi:unnamed protein product, partial [Protopolystoma xenopodis]